MRARQSGRQSGWMRGAAGWLLVLLAALRACSLAPPAAPREADLQWVAAWGSAQMVPDAANALPAEQWRDASLRQIVRLSLGGRALRVRISNVFGITPLVVQAASIARAVAPGRPDVDAATLRTLTFGGAAEATIAAGAERTSDPVALDVAAFTDLAVSLHFAQAPAVQTAHPGSRTTSFVARGNRVAQPGWPDAARTVRWLQLAAIDVAAPRGTGAVVVIGDSITDGYGTTTDRHERWTDFLAQRLAREGAAPRGIVNAGIGGNRLLRHGLGPSTAARFARDVLERSGVTHAIVLIGVNDLGVLRRDREDSADRRRALVADMQGAWREMARQARERGVCLVGATILPFGASSYYEPGDKIDGDRRALNRWIRESGTFDAVIDLDAALRDPARPDRLRADVDSGDGLHPSVAGYRAIAEAVPLSVLGPCATRPSGASAMTTTTFRNPVLSGFHADPSICRVGGDYYLATSSFEYFPGVPIHHSRDLVHWRLIGHALARESQLPLAGRKSSKGIFAPTLRCHGGVFHLVTTNVEGGGNFHVHARDPAGPWSEPVWLRESEWGMDPSLFFDDDGKVYYTRHGGGRNGGIDQAEIDLASGRLLQPPRRIWSGSGGIWPEGPHLYKVGGTYYLLISEGGTSYGHMLTVARSTSPWGPFEPHPHNPILSHRDRPALPLQAVGHADLVQTEAGDWWMVMLGIRPHERHHHIGRETLLAPVTWADGWPLVNHGQPIAERMPAAGLPPPAPWPRPAIRDDFDAPQLALSWARLRGPARGLWSLDERPGVLRLKGTADTLEDLATPAFVGRRQEHLRFRAATELAFEPAAPGHAAGLVLRQDEAHHALLRVTGTTAQRRVELVSRVGGVSRLVAARPLEAGAVQLQVDGSRERYEFAFRAGAGGPLQTLGWLPTRQLSSETTGGFTGVFIGLYASGAERGSAMPPADFAWFDYEPLDDD